MQSLITSGFESLCETIAPKYSKHVTGPASVVSFNLPLDAIGGGQVILVYKTMLSRWFCSRKNIKTAFVVSDFQVPCHPHNCYGFVPIQLNINNFMEHSASDSGQT